MVTTSDERTETLTPAQRAARTRRRKAAAAAAGDYGTLLLALHEAQSASDRAKSRKANGKHWRTYRREDSGRFAHHRYEVSRQARERDYAQKESALQRAVETLGCLELTWGWQQDGEDVPGHYHETPDSECWSCYGTGGLYEPTGCRRCGGTGLYTRWIPTHPAYWILYVDLPTGQVSFHCPNRGEGPDYAGEWDTITDASAGRIEAALEELTGGCDRRAG